MKSAQFHIPPTWMLSENARRRAASRKKGVRLIAVALFFAKFVREICNASPAQLLSGETKEKLEINPFEAKKIEKNAKTELNAVKHSRTQ